ncbi:dihydrolipoamide acetyltransferase family protein [Companilactobacillus jidongensis]|uniref:dihydrolipoamide acetyltransferase family protein n=1 Tax=Companilactobacillus jidongensis TaxID=2486006 RepID=UPI000F784DCB|nr:dihydrolipoamide acetyltransferase family protein [Companilactobacillus jidongensis]
MSELIIKMPPLGESVTEATVSQWMVKPGDHVKKYDPILEAISDKVVTEIPSNDDGVIEELLVNENDVVPIGTDILKMTTEGAVGSVPVAKVETRTTESQNSPSFKATGRFSPAVLKVAGERNIDLSSVSGTGKDGRITRKDVLNYQPKETPIISSQPAQLASEPVIRSTPVLELNNNDAVTKAGPVRKMIAQNMLKSIHEIPQAWTMIEVDVTGLVKLRNSLKNEFKEQNEFKLSYFPFFVKAVSSALRNNPKLNSSWQNDEIIQHKDINISIAVATDDALFVPVIKHADRLSITGIAAEVSRLANCVKTNTLKGSDNEGGTITVNNTGSFGSIESMGIINYPQAAILQVESIRKELSVLDDDTFGIRNKVNLCLTLDHRILDGLAAGKFLNEVKANLEAIDQNTNIY